MVITIGINTVVGRKRVSAFAHYFKLMWQVKQQLTDLG